VSDANNWNPWYAPLALVVALVAEVIVGLIVLLVGLGGHVTQAQANNPPPAITDVSTGLGEACFVLVALWLAWWRGRPIPAQFGLRRPPAGVLRALFAVIVGYIAFLVISAVWTAIVSTSASERYLVKDVGATHAGTWGVLGSVLVLCVIAPFCEEFLFRGFIFGALRNWRGPLVAALLTGVLFGAVHVGSAPAVDLVPLAVLGMILCAMRQLTGSLYPGILMHMFNNAIALVVNADWSFAAFCAVLAGSLALGAALIAIAQRTLHEQLV
jgi:uncharacterized protein